MAVKKTPAPQRPDGFVPLSTVRSAAPSPDTVLAEIRALYFGTSARTIDADLAHAVALLKALPDEATRERATVYMEGLTEMRREWAPRPPRRRTR